MTRLLRGAVLCLLLASAGLGIAACGKKGALVPPPGSTYPQQYPKE